MILRDLIISNSWLSIELIFTKLYPDQVSSINGYERVFNELKTLPPIYSEITILISNEIDSFDNENYVNVSGYNPSKTSRSIDDLTDSLALEFTPWNEWLGMKIDQDSLKNFNQLELICHCLHEMTFMGFSQREIESELDKIKEAAEDIKHMTNDERKENFISFNDLNQLLDFKNNKYTS
jgi:hypothetical protein